MYIYIYIYIYCRFPMIFLNYDSNSHNALGVCVLLILTDALYF